MSRSSKFIECLDSRTMFTNIVVTGTSSGDTIYCNVDQANSNYVDVRLNGVVTQYSAVRSISISGGSGNDTIEVDGAITVPTTVSGDGGNDVLTGSSYSLVTGGTGDDQVMANAGALGCTLQGDAGNDRLDGDEYITSGTDYLYGGTGADTLFGGGGTAYLYQNDASNTSDSQADYLYLDRANGRTGPDHTFVVSADGDSISTYT